MVVDRKQEGCDRLLLRTVILLQLVAVFCVFLNHLPISLLKVEGEPILPTWITHEPALVGIVFIFFSSGFLHHFSRKQCSSFTGLAFVCRRFWRLALPTYAAIAFDYWLQGHPVLSLSADPEQALPLVLTLTHTWTYKTLGQGSLSFPFAGSNLVWIASTLMFLSILYACSYRIWDRMNGSLAVGMIAVCTVAHALWFREVVGSKVLIDYALAHYGAEINPTYSFSFWLAEYCPYVQVAPFLCGVAFAQFLRNTSHPKMSSLVLLGGIALASFVLGAHTFSKGLGVSISALVAVSIFRSSYERWLGSADNARWLDRFGNVTLELFIFHLLVFISFTGDSLLGQVANVGPMLAVRVFFAWAITLWICLFLFEKVFPPVLSKISGFLGILAGSQSNYL